MSVNNEKTRVIILTGNYRVEGDIHLSSEARVTDYIINSRDFIAVTDAEIKDNAGHPLLTSKFVNVHRNRIEVIMPIGLATSVGTSV